MPRPPTAPRPHRLLLTAAVLALCLPAAPQPGADVDLGALSLEELSDLEVRLVSRKAEPLFEAPAAAFVLTRDDLRRSGATSIPEALRLVPGLQVARIDANKWAVSARGFNGRFAQKLLVHIDGRSVYTPLFSGVVWEAQDMVLEDVERIEVIRGPGATLWGANAVNGIVNIVTRDADDTEGGLVVAGAGTEERAFTSLRYGAGHGNVAGRVWFRAFDRDALVGPDGARAHDDWRMARGGFRADWHLPRGSLASVQGQLYDGAVGQTFRLPLVVPPYVQPLDDRGTLHGAHLLSRWERRPSASSQMALQAYYDRSEREDAGLWEHRDTWDLDFQHRFARRRNQEMIWGAGYRYTRDRTRDTDLTSFDPRRRGENLFSGFVQNELSLADRRLRLTAGAKVEHNAYTGWEQQPSARLLWTPGPRQAVWASASRALRVPSRADEDLLLALRVVPPSEAAPGRPPAVLFGQGVTGLATEKLYALEAGYRARPTPSLSLDLAVFHNTYRDLRAAIVGVPRNAAEPAPHLEIMLYSANALAAETRGLEAVADWQAVPGHWRLRAAYTYLSMDVTPGPDVDPSWKAQEGEDPEHQLVLWSSLNPAPRWQADLLARYVDELPTVECGAYVVVDARLAWRPSERLELSLTGRNLLDARHPEFKASFIDALPNQTQQEAYAAIRWGR